MNILKNIKLEFNPRSKTLTTWFYTTNVSMSNLNFGDSEFRFATDTLATTVALAPTIYFLLPAKKQDSTEHVKTFNILIKS